LQNVPDRQPYDEFQFLVGTLKTVEPFPIYTVGASFQFLVGTLKTGFPPFGFLLQTIVSIPRRYAENVMGCPKRVIPDDWFQFLVGTLKTYWMITDALIGIGFNSS